MKRKVNLVGQNTLTVSLPNKWAEKYGLKKGDEIEVLEKGNALMMATSLKLPKKEITIDVPNVESYLERFICAPYVKGYDIINVKYNDPKVYGKVLKTSKLLMGFEVIENTQNSCKLVNVSTKLEQNFEVLLSRLFVSGTTFLKELLLRIKKDEKSEFQELLEYEFNANRIALFCRRVIQTGDYGTNIYSSLSLYSIVAHLEESIDNFRYIVEIIGDSKLRLDKDTVDLFEKCIMLQEINFTIFNKIIKGSDLLSQLSLFKEHKSIRSKIRHNHHYFKGNTINSYVCNKLMNVVEISHHISEELFY